MIKNTSASLRTAGRFLLVSLAIFLLLPAVSLAQQSAVSPAVPSGASAGEFFKSMVGEWIGTCEQSTNGVPADNKYFHVVVKQLAPDTFDSKFEYFLVDKKSGAVNRIGESAITTKVLPDGTVKNQITGSGTVLVENKPKSQNHDLQEVLAVSPTGELTGKGSGKVSVSGMPFGVGKNGKIQAADSIWSIQDGVLSIQQNLRVGFKALIFSKKFSMTAKYTARRGSDVAKLIGRPVAVSSAR